MIESSNAVSAVHYENDPEFFHAFLDPYLKYGSGYFEGEDSFEVAARRMLDLTLAQGQIPENGTVLDVGSGWGSMLRRLRETLPGRRYHHINPSAQQRAFIAEKLGAVEAVFPTTAEAAEVPGNTYDAIFLNDSACHLRDRTGVLRKLGEALRPGGRIVLQDTFFLTEQMFQSHRRARTTRFVQDHIFGFAEIPSLETFTSEVASAGLRIERQEDLTPHYLRTAAAWIARLQRLDQERFPLRDGCIRYLRFGAAGLDYTTAQIFVVLRRLDGSRARLRSNLAVVDAVAATGKGASR
jgi:cyclopropane-fatty-acyl-phospholipid synthase